MQGPLLLLEAKIMSLLKNKNLLKYSFGADVKMHIKWMISTMSINDCQLWCQKICQKISVIKTNSFDWDYLLLMILKNSSFWHFKGGFVFVMITEIF